MRGLLASSIGVTCAAALALPLTPLATAATPAAHPAPRPGVEVPAAGRPATPAEAPGSTQSLPLAALGRSRALGPAAEQGLPRRDVRHFSLVGVVWDDPDTVLHGTVQVRTRAAGTGAWSGWQGLETHNDDAADPGTAERTSGRVRGATAPLWVGDSDGVEVRVQAAQDLDRTTEEATRDDRTAISAPLPTGLRLELVDPGERAPEREPAVAGAPRTTVVPRTVPDASAANLDLAPLGATEIPALNRAQTLRELSALRADGTAQVAPRGKPYIGPRPRIVTRRGWGADERLREKKFVYSKKVKAVFVHHTASGNGYRCAEAPSLIRGIYRYHVKSMGWRDIGYNFLVDKCGTIYEGRAGGVAKPVLGAHTLGFNTNSMGIAVLGSYDTTKPPAAATKAVAKLTAWKLGLFGANPSGRTYLKSGGGNLYRKGKNVRLNVISGHRDGFATECPGRLLYRKLGATRTSAARYQGR
ncbi:peptidoglycan recognition protein [Streptomyces sp. NPDC047072]|uniref:peptidoglycan recognition protein family protein n=1 Tax=Streptomyces sp. NPDC047072 TaxID=3154809 RepID=UPI0033FC65FF